MKVQYEYVHVYHPLLSIQKEGDDDNYYGTNTRTLR